MPLPPPKTKTYVREEQRLFSQDEVRNWFKEAHEHCKKTIKRTVHKTPKGKTVFRRERGAYVNCIRDYINKKIEERKREAERTA